MAARSTTHGTPVKSWSTTRAGMKGISPRAAAGLVPGAELADVVFGDDAAAGVAKRVLEQNADGEGQAVEPGDALAGELGEPVDGGLLAPEAGRWHGSRMDWWREWS